MARARKTAPPAQTDIEEAIAAAPPLPVVPAIDLITEYREIETWAEAQDKAYAEFMKPRRDRMNEIKQQLLAMALAQKVNSFPTDAGTAYISEGITAKVDPNTAPYKNERGEEVTGREALLDFFLENWEKYGAEYAQIGITLDGVKAFIAEHRKPPPGIAIQQWQRLNIRKT